ncbi:MAG TPA: glycoside hydrolase family 88 protein [Vicinamibacterales bacterium]|nr:glycoside hydrolase family 88 protein [Vicinamibacterales bacterium]
MIHIDRQRSPRDLLPRLERVFELSAAKIRSIERTWPPEEGAPVFTVDGRYRSRAWTDWTQGFQFGSALLQFDATGDREFLELGRSRTVQRMAPHLTHTGVHDHGFNNVSTYGNLWRLAREGRIDVCEWEVRYYGLALCVSGAVQAGRWTRLPDGGFIHSFNGAHSLFVDTIRSLRALALAFVLGHHLFEEQDANVSLLERLVHHARATARYSVYYGHGRDRFDVRGRVAHESLFNPANGSYRGPGTQQGYSPFSTWTRGLSWAMLGFAEQLEFVGTVSDAALEPCGGRDAVEPAMLEAARATCERYLEVAASDGVPYWDSDAPGLAALQGWRDRPADPFNDREPVDSSAAAIAAQGLLRLSHVLAARGQFAESDTYAQAGLRVLDTLFDPAGPYLSGDPDHQGLILHSVYHWPRGWDYVPPGAAIPRGESSQWGDYHAREAALYVKRLATGAPYLTFFGPRQQDAAGIQDRGDAAKTPHDRGGANGE